MKKMAALFLLTMFTAAPALAMDMFNGTLEIRDGRPLMVRCGLTKDEYVLFDLQGSPEEYLRQMMVLGVDRGEKIQATILGEVRSDGGRPVLVVESIEEVKPGSCHLDSMF